MTKIIDAVALTGSLRVALSRYDEDVVKSLLNCVALSHTVGYIDATMRLIDADELIDNIARGFPAYARDPVRTAIGVIDAAPPVPYQPVLVDLNLLKAHAEAMSKTQWQSISAVDRSMIDSLPTISLSETRKWIPCSESLPYKDRIHPDVTDGMDFNCGRIT